MQCTLQNWDQSWSRIFSERFRIEGKTKNLSKSRRMGIYMYQSSTTLGHKSSYNFPISNYNRYLKSFWKNLENIRSQLWLRQCSACMNVIFSDYCFSFKIENTKIDQCSIWPGITYAKKIKMDGLLILSVVFQASLFWRDLSRNTIENKIK